MNHEDHDSSMPLNRDVSPNTTHLPFFTVQESFKDSPMIAGLDDKSDFSLNSNNNMLRKSVYNKMETKMSLAGHPMNLQKQLTPSDYMKTSPSPSETDSSDTLTSDDDDDDIMTEDKSAGAASPIKSMKSMKSMKTMKSMKSMKSVDTPTEKSFNKGLTLSKKQIRNIVKQSDFDNFSLSPHNRSIFYNHRASVMVRSPVAGGSLMENGALIQPRRVPVGGNIPKASMMNLLAMARRLGLMKRDFAYEQYVTKDQFNIIKDVSTGRFDFQDEKRFRQLEKLKSKIRLAMEQKKPPKERRRRTTTIKWDKNTVPDLKTHYKQFVLKIKEVLTPNNKLRILWDFYILLLVAYDLIIIPLQLAFDIPFMHYLFAIDIIVDLSFLMDIMLNFNTGYYSKGLLVMDRKKIAWHYFKKWLWIDALTVFPFRYIWDSDDNYEKVSGSVDFEFIRSAGFGRIIRIVRFLRVFKLKKNFLKLESYIDFTATMTGIFGFLKLCVIILLIAHWLACIWHLVAVLALEDHPESWLTQSGLVDAYWIDRYVGAIYWAIMTMTTVGYGDLSPITRNEKIVAVLAMLVASGVFAYTMNRINVILAGLDTTSEQYKRALGTIGDYMKKKKVDKELQIKIKKYLEYALAVETSLDSNETNLDAYLNQSLKDELITQVYGKILMDNPVLKQFSNDFIARASLLMKEKIYSPEDIIFLEDKHKDVNLYFINVGKVEIFHFYSSSFLKTLMKGSSFGEAAFFTGFTTGISARSVDFSTIYYIKREDFIGLLDDFSSEKERFHEVKDKILVYKDYSALQAKCYSCGNSDHWITECPKVHVTIQKEKFIKAYIDFKDKYMTGFIRSGRRTNQNKPSLQKLDRAAKKIHKKIKEGAYPEYKVRETPAPELLEQLKSLASMNSGVPKISIQGVDETESNKDIPILQLGENVLDLAKKAGSSGGENSIQIQVDSKNQKRFSVIFTPSTLPLAKDPAKSYVKKRTSMQHDKNTPLENDIDTVANLPHYFPHNNFSHLFPKYTYGARMSLFDFKGQADSSKSTMKKFVNILRNRVNVRKDQLESAFAAAAGRREPPKKTFFATAAAGVKEGPRRLSVGKDRSRMKRASVLVAYAHGDDADQSDDIKGQDSDD